MKRFITNCLATTGLTLVILAMIASIYQAEFLCITSVYQSFIVNIIMHIGLIFVRKIESKYFIIEFIVEIGYVIGILFVFGFLFKWYSNPPLWVVILMGIIVYFIGCLINIMKINNDISLINDQLKILKTKKTQ